MIDRIAGGRLRSPRQVGRQISRFALAELRDRIRTELLDGLAPMVEDIEACEGGQVYDPAVRWLAGTGWIGMSIPREHGGEGLGHLARIVSIEETSRVNAAAGNTLQSGSLGTAMVVGFGSEDQCERWLPDFASGRKLVSIVMTEPQSGSHLLGMRGSAERARDGGWRVSARKWFIANGHIAHAHGTILRTTEGNGELSAFLIDAETRGVSRGVAHPTTGQLGFALGEIVFDDAHVDADRQVGEIGNGLEVAHYVSTIWGKPNLAAVALGLHQAILDEAVRYSTEERQLFGRRLSELDSAREKLGAIRARVGTCRSLLYSAARALDDNVEADESIILAKMTGMSLLRDSARDLVDLCGARGVMKGWPAERYWRDVLMVLAPAGTPEVHRKRMAEFSVGEYRGLRQNTELPGAR